MKALHWDGSRLSLEHSYADPSSTESLALVRVRMAGICSTDLQIFKGYMGFRGVPGHEFVGEVAAGPPGLQGRRVVGEINFACGACEFCARDLGRHCLNRKVLGIFGADGAFSEFLLIPPGNLLEVPGVLSDEEAVFTEPLAAAFEILEQVHFEPGEQVVVLGDGKLGLLCAQVVRSVGAEVLVIGKHPAKLRIVEKLGIRTVTHAGWKPYPADVVVEATGSPNGLDTALSIVKPRGKLVLKSTLAAQHTLSLAPLVVKEVTVIGSRCGRFLPALQSLERKTVSVLPLIERVFPLTEGIEAAGFAARPGIKKVLLRCL